MSFSTREGAEADLCLMFLIGHQPLIEKHGKFRELAVFLFLFEVRSGYFQFIFWQGASLVQTMELDDRLGQRSEEFIRVR